MTAIAVAMSAFHLYAVYDIVPTQELRYTHVAFVLLLAFLGLSDGATASRDRIRWWDVVAGLTSVGILIYAIQGGEDFTDRATLPTQLDTVLGVIFIAAASRCGAPDDRTDHADHCDPVHRLRDARPVFAATVDTSRLRYLPSASATSSSRSKEYFGVPVDVSATLIILFTIYGAFLAHSGAGKFFIDFSLAAMGGRHNSAGRAVVVVVVSAWWAIGFGRRDHRNGRLGRLSDDEESRVSPRRRGRAARRRRARRNHIAAGARCRRVPDRRIPEDQLPRRHRDGDHPDHSLLLVAFLDGRTRFHADLAHTI